ncbi:MAG: dienelactone hydrolase family protein [Janthinobacterium lividum]
MTIQTRREFVKTTLAAGFALAVRPVTAQTIHTDTHGLVVGEIQIPTTDGRIPGYHALPDSGRAFPVILVVQEIFGVHEHIKDVCRRFAKQGYLAIAPELYAREGDVSSMTDIGAIVSQVVSKVPDAQVMTDLDATVAWAEKSGHGDVGKLGITGFCWGGRVVWLYAAHNPHLKAGVAWYGKLVGQPDPLHPNNPVDIAADLKAPVLGFYGGEDHGITQDTVTLMKAALAKDHQPSQIIVYPDAGHGFHADYRPGYNAKDAADGDKKMLEWFHTYGVTPQS